MSFSNRFELLDLLRDEEVQTFRARERATGRAVEVHVSASAGLLAKLESQTEPQRVSVIDRGSHEGKLYLVTAPLGLDSVGAWRIKPHLESQEKAPQEKAPPGDFTRMFELHQAPEPVATPAARVVQAPAASEPGEFTRAFKKPASAPAATPAGSDAPGQMGEFTRMFQTPTPPPPASLVPDARENSVPAPPVPASQIAASANAPAGRVPVGLIVTAIVIICAIAVFVLMRTLY